MTRKRERAYARLVWLMAEAMGHDARFVSYSDDRGKWAARAAAEASCDRLTLSLHAADRAAGFAEREIRHETVTLRLL